MSFVNCRPCMAMLSVRSAALSFHSMRVERGVVDCFFIAGDGECALSFARVGVPRVLGVRGLRVGVRFGVVLAPMPGVRRSAGGDSEDESAGESAVDVSCGVRGVDGCDASGRRAGLVRCTTDIVRTWLRAADATDGARRSGDTAPGGRLWWRAARVADGVSGVAGAVSARSTDLIGNELGGIDGRRSGPGTLDLVVALAA